jgi:ribose transport system permease protein
MNLGLLAALSGNVMAARLDAAMPTAAQGYELDVIAAVVIGGTSLSGGQGTVIGTLIGALIMAVVRNGLNLLLVSTYWQQVIIGFIVIGAVAFDVLNKKIKN